MRKKNKKRKHIRLRDILRSQWINITAFFILIAISVTGMLLLRSTLLRNAYDTGISLSRNYASEESGTLAVYETLLSFGTTSVDRRLSDGDSRDELIEWADIYFERLNAVLGQGTIDPYLVLEGEIIAANPWEGDAAYDAAATEWYQNAVAADGAVTFTDVYIDAIYNKPVITMSQACRNTQAVLAFDILLENFDFRFNTNYLDYGDSFFLCDSAGSLIYKRTDLTLTDAKLGDYLQTLIEKIDSGSLDAFNAYVADLDGDKRMICHTRMDNDWYAIVTIPYSNILGDLHWFSAIFGLMIGLFFLALLGMTWRDMKSKARIDRTNETVRVLGNSYYALYRVDYEADTYEMIKGSDYVRGRIPPSGNYPDLIRVAGEVIEANAFREFEEKLSSENIRRLVRQRIRDFGGEFLRRFGDTYRWVSVRVLFDESLAPGEVVLSFREVEQERQQQMREQQVLEDALQIAQRNEAAKQAFFNNMSHDMRTPLNAIIGLCELAQKNIEDQEKTAGYLTRINTAGGQLLHLINDILDMSRMEQGKVILNNQQFDLRSCLEDSLSAFRFRSETEHKQLIVDVQLENSRVLGDPFRINQILNNLLSNAFKFTPENGTISVSVIQMDKGDYAKYKFTVADTGAGMSKDFLPHLFEPYSREMRFGARQIAGTGLGMSITKNLVVQMNGEINVESEQGKGSVFTVILPFAVVEESTDDEVAENKQQEPQTNMLANRHILLAEDNAVNMEITTEMLSMNGMTVTQAWNGQEAVDQFKNAQPFTFDAILMDMQMPEMDGCEAAKQIRSLHRPDAKSVPIIAVTANAFAEDIAATTAAGMNAHVSKPIDFKLLCKTLEDLLQEKPEP